MNNLSTNLPGPAAPDPIIRNLQNGLLVTASSDLGKSAVTSQVSLLSKIDSELPMSKLDQMYQGVIEISHDDTNNKTNTDQSDIREEATEEQKPIGRQVHNHYIEEPKEPKRTLKELEDLYPNESPLLAPN